MKYCIGPIHITNKIKQGKTSVEILGLSSFTIVSTELTLYILV